MRTRALDSCGSTIHASLGSSAIAALDRSCQSGLGSAHGCGRIGSILTQESFIALALLAATSLVAGFFAYIYTLKRQIYLLLWTAGWSLFALHYLGPALSLWMPDGPVQSSLDQWLYGLAGLLFLLGTQLYAQRKPSFVPAAITACV